LKGSANLSVTRRRTIVLVVFCACVFVGAGILLSLKTGPMPAKLGPPKTDSVRATPSHAKAGEKPKVEPLPVAPSANTIQAPEGTTTVTDADLNYIAARHLLIPVAGVPASQLRDTSTQARSEGRQHDAIDIMAPQGTPVLATTDGLVLKLFQSDRGGVTLYELDPSGRYVYYYAHLMHYADGITEGKQLRRGDVIAYVGDTGNAGAGNFHLHFAISKLTSPHKWSGGDPINPYPLLVGQ
jgi:murein DD-endopeptidase MepM/ murein hydrolase activator NlpD